MIRKVIDKIICYFKLSFHAERPPPPQVIQHALFRAAEEQGDVSPSLRKIVKDLAQRQKRISNIFVKT